MPVYDLLGGKARDAVPIYAHADGLDMQQVEENVRKYMEEGYRHRQGCPKSPDWDALYKKLRQDSAIHGQDGIGVSSFILGVKGPQLPQ